MQRHWQREWGIEFLEHASKPHNLSNCGGQTSVFCLSITTRHNGLFLGFPSNKRVPIFDHIASGRFHANWTRGPVSITKGLKLIRTGSRKENTKARGLLHISHHLSSSLHMRNLRGMYKLTKALDNIENIWSADGGIE